MMSMEFVDDGDCLNENDHRQPSRSQWEEGKGVQGVKYCTRDLSGVGAPHRGDQFAKVGADKADFDRNDVGHSLRQDDRDH